MVRVFVGSSKEQVKLVEWLTGYIRDQYAGAIEPVPWTIPWPGGRYTLETLLRFVGETDAAILFWTADDKTWYRDVEYHEPRDNLVFEAGLFIAAHGRERTQVMIPEYKEADRRRNVRIPSDVAGLTYNLYQWADGEPEATGLPRKARFVCDTLKALGPRPRLPIVVRDLARHEGVEEVRTFAGDWPTLHVEGIRCLAARAETQTLDILVAYRVGEIHRALARHRQNPALEARVCFGNMWDDDLLKVYQRKYINRSAEYIRNAVKESIVQLLGECRIIEDIPGKRVVIDNVVDRPKARYDLRLTPQRITYSFYRVDDFAFILPLDMKTDQDPAPRGWLFTQDLAPRTFEHYVQEYDRMFGEATRAFPNG